MFHQPNPPGQPPSLRQISERKNKPQNMSDPPVITPDGAVYRDPGDAARIKSLPEAPKPAPFTLK